MTRDEAIAWLKLERKARSGISKGEGILPALDMAIESLSAEQEWIPVSERLPKVSQDVLFCDGEFTQEGYLMGSGDWFQFRWSTVQSKRVVTAWQPLPKPYREDGKA